MTRNFSMRLVCFLSIWLSLIAFASVGLTEVSSGNFVFLELGTKTVGTAPSYELVSRSIDHTGRPISTIQTFPLCQGQPSNGCIVVGIAPIVQDTKSLTVVTENILP